MGLSMNHCISKHSSRRFAALCLSLLLSLPMLASCSAGASQQDTATDTKSEKRIQLADPGELTLKMQEPKSANYTKVLDETGLEAGSFQLAELPSGTQSLVFTATCNGKGGYRIFDASDDPFILLTACDNNANISIPVENYKPPLNIWSSGDFRVVVFASPDESK